MSSEHSSEKSSLLSSLRQLLPGKIGLRKSPAGSGADAAAIEAWLVQRVADYLQVAAGQIDVQAPFADFGLDSRTAVSLSGELERWLGQRLSPTLIWDYPTIEAVARHLAAADSTGDSTPSAVPPTSARVD